jgi:hypothetical protein
MCGSVPVGRTPVDRPQAMSKEDDEQLMESFSSAMLPP